MEVDDEGLRFIEGFEGWKKKMPDGRYCAYQAVFNGKKDVPTIGPGLTEGVLMGMIWTRDECSAAFKKELVKHEAAINRMVTVDMSQHQFNALVSLSYNVGIGAVKRSTVLKKFNAGDITGAAEAFKLFSKAGGAPVAGLIRRRAAEAAMFLDPDGDEINPMPQKVDPQAAKPSRGAVAGAAATVAAGASQIPVKDILEAARGKVDQAKQAREIVQDAGGFIPPALLKNQTAMIGVGVVLAFAAGLILIVHRRS